MGIGSSFVVVHGCLLALMLRVRKGDLTLGLGSDAAFDGLAVV